MTSDDISSSFRRVWRVRVVSGDWRRVPKLGRRVVAHVSSDGGLNLEFCRSVDVEADMAACVTKDDL